MCATDQVATRILLRSAIHASLARPTTNKHIDTLITTAQICQEAHKCRRCFVTIVLRTWPSLSKSSFYLAHVFEQTVCIVLFCFCLFRALVLFQAKITQQIVITTTSDLASYYFTDAIHGAAINIKIISPRFTFCVDNRLQV